MEGGYAAAAHPTQDLTGLERAVAELPPTTSGAIPAQLGMAIVKAFIAGIVGVFLLSSSSAEPPHQKSVGTEWVWFTDYAFFRSEWTVNAEDGCELEVGSGVKIQGKPRGSVRRFSKHIVLTAWGVGAIHVRAVAGIAPCEVRVDMGDFDLLPVVGKPSLLKGVIKDGKVVYESIGGPKHEFDRKP